MNAALNERIVILDENVTKDLPFNAVEFFLPLATSVFFFLIITNSIFDSIASFFFNNK